MKTRGKTTFVLWRVMIVDKYSGREVSHDFRSLHVLNQRERPVALAFNQRTPAE